MPDAPIDNKSRPIHTEEQHRNARISSGKISKQRAQQPKPTMNWDLAIPRIKNMLKEMYKNPMTDTENKISEVIESTLKNQIGSLPDRYIEWIDFDSIAKEIVIALRLGVVSPLC